MAVWLSTVTVGAGPGVGAGSGPAGELGLGPAAGGGVENQLVDVETGEMTGRALDHVGAGAEGDPVGVGSAGLDRQGVAVQGGRRWTR